MFDGSATTTYPFKHYSSLGSTSTVHIFAGDELIAVVENVGTTSTKRYVHTDHLGGTNVVTNASGDHAQTLDYYPFGTARVNSQAGFNESRKFTGHEYDSTSDLTYANARYYDQDTGRFLSQDPAFLEIGAARFEKDYKRPLQAHVQAPQILNSYGYALNNPILYSDPSGEILPFIIGAFAVYGVAQTYVDYVDFQTVTTYRPAPTAMP